jgi:hypothetical protein
MPARGRNRGSVASEPPIRIDAHEFARLMRDAKAFDRDLALKIRRNMRLAAAPIVADAKRTVLEPPPNDKPGTRGVRRALASGISFRVGTGAGKKGGSVRISASSKGLPPERKAMLRLYNKKKGWRHPVYARGGDGKLAVKTRRKRSVGGLIGRRETVWVHQQGRPYFGSVILEHRRAMQLAVLEAMNEAARALARKNP